MNGPSSMYKLRPAFKLADDIELPKCMYSMKNIQAVVRNADFGPIGRNHVEKSNIANKKQSQDSPNQNGMTPQITNLESRQEAILAQLALLKSQIADLRAELGAPLKPGLVSSPRPCALDAVAKSKKARICHDVVINANPKSPPYSLAALCNCWGKEHKIRTSCHVHSSVQDVSSNLKTLFVDNGCDDRSSADINVTLTWKNVPGDLEMIISPISQSGCILGEVNALRYLSRLLPAAPHNYEAGDAVVATQMDAFLDLAHAGLIHGNNKERQATLRVINGHLGRTEWFGGGGTPTIADMALWSALRQTGCDSDAPSNVKRWFSKCNSSFVPHASGC